MLVRTIPDSYDVKTSPITSLTTLPTIYIQIPSYHFTKDRLIYIIIEQYGKVAIWRGCEGFYFVLQRASALIVGWVRDYGGPAWPVLGLALASLLGLALASNCPFWPQIASDSPGWPCFGPGFLFSRGKSNPSPCFLWHRTMAPQLCSGSAPNFANSGFFQTG